MNKTWSVGEHKGTFNEEGTIGWDSELPSNWLEIEEQLYKGFDKFSIQTDIIRIAQMDVEIIQEKLQDIDMESKMTPIERMEEIQFALEDVFGYIGEILESNKLRMEKLS